MRTTPISVRPERRHLLRQGAAALAAAGLTTVVTQAQSQAPLGRVRMPTLSPRVRVLRNGLQVVVLPDERVGAGTAAVQVWYRVGGKDDPPGRSGFAHLFEHLMFKRTRHLADEAFDRLTEDVGGQNNAFTTEDATVYLNVVPANHVERLLWAEAERMAQLQVSEPQFRSERAVVESEFRQKVLVDPYGRLFHGMAPAFWQVHPYRHPVIGRMDDLNAASLDDVRRFHATYYRPDNATLIVAGDVVPARVDAWVDRHFGALVAPDAPVPRVLVREPRRERNQWTTLTAPQVPAPALALLWQAPGAAHPEAAALRVAAALLGEGDSSRLSVGLVERALLAQSAGFGVDLHADAGMLSAWAIAAGPSVVGGDARRDPRLPLLETALLRAIHRLAHGRIPIGELDKVRTQLLTEALVARQTAEGRALALGWAVVRRQDARAADVELRQLQAVRAEDVQRVLRTYVLDAHRVTLRYVQAPSASGGIP
ncbi:pitrilysin family protein [Sphaerotilus sp.]|uniref:M16 family metallopeptidase n=1 Tax=Sphaerotilus sp. TaxID=2093942 RepID=UPI00286E7141|nr:pitrilysin family protein [Sphaerotilus sp.]